MEIIEAIEKSVTYKAFYKGLGVTIAKNQELKGLFLYV